MRTLPFPWYPGSALGLTCVGSYEPLSTSRQFAEALAGASQIAASNHALVRRAARRRQWTVFFAVVQIVGLACLALWPHTTNVAAFLWGTALITLFPGNFLSAFLVERLFWNSGLSLTSMSLLELPLLVAINAALWFAVIATAQGSSARFASLPTALGRGSTPDVPEPWTEAACQYPGSIGPGRLFQVPGGALWQPAARSACLNSSADAWRASCGDETKGGCHARSARLYLVVPARLRCARNCVRGVTLESAPRKHRAKLAHVPTVR